MKSRRQQRLRLLPALLSFISYLLLFFTTNASSSSPDNNDLTTLLSLKSFISEDPTGALSSWDALDNSTLNNGTHGFCRWTGVTCTSSFPPRVAALHLPGLGLVGTLSPHLGNLTQLNLLDLSHNKLEGEIPPSLAGCSVLCHLNLSGNFLSGAVPPAMGHLSRLAVLSMEKNNISGLIPSSFANLTALTVFGIASNSVHGEVPEWLGNLTRLIYLNIGQNIISGHVPPPLSELAHLQHLGVAGNVLEGTIPPSLFNMSSLEVFDVGNNNLSGSLPPDMGFMLPNLRIFNALGNRFEGPIPFSLSNISRLQTLNLNGNRFQGRIPPNIGINGVLVVFDVSDNELQATDPKDWDFLTSLANCKKLKTIGLETNNLSGTLPDTIANLSLELEYMWLQGNQITGHIPKAIGRYSKLKSLALGYNLFTGTIPSDIGKLTQLHDLCLEQNSFHGEIPPSLGNLTQLNWFNLSSNYLDGRIPATLGNLSTVTYFDISQNLLSGQIPEEIVSISSLTELFDLSNNALTGPIPLQIGRLVNLVKIDLSSNKLSGEIPGTIGRCLEMQFLYFQGNLLHGQIPNDLKAMKGLEVLDLSNNKLSGPIPEFLGSFMLLRSLNLSFNKLSGPVPNKNIFTNARSVSLASNGPLCGGPPFFHFPPCPYQSPSSNKQNQRLQTLIFIVPALAFVIICIATCYYIKKLKSKAVGCNQEHGSTIVSVMHHKISYSELSTATNSFSIENLIGRGSFGSVYKGILSFGRHSINVAVKIIDLQQRGACQSFMSECNALKRIKHRKLVKVITVCDSLDHNGDEFKALVLEFIPNGSLDKWLYPSCESVNRLSLEQRLSIALDIAEALEYLHHHINPSIAHCDIKPSNILLDEDMTAHIGDFGLAKIMNVGSSGKSLGGSTSVGIKGTFGYLAPVWHKNRDFYRG
ncbi:hypothetical protein PVAP13_6KG148842 [Panicum virgatum]|uniref:non-specific serine/threonine protein kinase n=1 Tax=Panicum virgatum TaxID=38727 RepID=A0A8T0RBB0_PANVG|nr:hypothetical protein PVAP13_6KG148842 [Panicum virgatum]